MMHQAHQWHTLSKDQIERILHTDSSLGLSTVEARRRLARFGPNKLAEKPKKPKWRLFVQQFQDFMVMVLLAATAISALLGELADSIAIAAIVLVNAVLGYMQEAKAEASLAALKQLVAPRTRVVRDQRITDMRAEELVPGDLVEIESGDRIPADLRLFSASSLATNESPLTGESLPVSKSTTWVGCGREGPGDRRNTLFMGTTAVRGRGRGIVVATGMHTQIGEIAGLIQDADAGATPLQARLEQLGKSLVAVCLGLVSLVFAAGILQGMPVYKMFLTGVSLAVAAIPEGLPAVVTIALAIGVQRMIRRRGIIRSLPAVETLGCATVICADKTGTLTKNEMTVVRLVTAGRQLDVSGTGFSTSGEFREHGRLVNPAADPDWRTALAIAALCNHARLLRDKKGDPSRTLGIIGDPTEAALAILAAKGGMDPDSVRLRYPAVAEVPFDSYRKRMSVVVRWQGLRSMVKGAPDVIIERCTHVLSSGQPRPLGSAERRFLRERVTSMAEESLRVLALAYRPLPVSQVSDPPAERLVEQGLVFVALAAMMDPPREEVRRAIAIAKRAGIRTIMVTGDHKDTALAVGRRLGLSDTAGAATGDHLDTLNDRQLAELLRKTSIFARVSPRHKLRIVRMLRSQGEVVAMTGDGINDAPAVKEADIGIAMGLSGTDVTKDASAMVLADDNYATIVAAIEEGRGIYDNIRKFIRYLLACNVGEVLTMLLATVQGMPLPLVPIQILWMNLITDGLPAIALGVDPPHDDVMQRPPRKANESIFARGLHRKILMRGTLIGLCTVAVFRIATTLRPSDLEWSQTLAFTTLVMAQLFYVFQCRSEFRSVFEVGLLKNRYLVAAVSVSVAMHLLVIYWPITRPIFHTVPLSLTDWLVVLTFSGWSIIMEGTLRLIRLYWGRRVSLIRVTS
ncbi:MAG: calcium-translocating P-type ATPase, SERCA-type [Limnochordia bacterium]|jgi:Ca2+-transporting ATPase